jgi:uncharacterized protein YndB with AHSA1/START domain
VKDVLEELAATAREVARRGTGDDELIAVALRREYPVEIEDVWEAVTDPRRLARWFAPVSGDLREGGSFRVAGNAEGEIRECVPPSTLTVTWGGPVSVVRVRLAASDGGTALHLEHTVPAAFAGSGAGALYVGPGWDVALRSPSTPRTSTTSRSRSRSTRSSTARSSSSAGGPRR